MTFVGCYKYRDPKEPTMTIQSAKRNAVLFEREGTPGTGMNTPIQFK